MLPIKPITIGGLKLANNLIQAPLAGVSCAPFRVLAERYGQPGFCCTEMISAKDLIKRKINKQSRYLYKDKNEGLLCYQLSGNNAEELAEATKIVVDCGADLIDLNCGCPKTKIRAKDCGSKHTENPLRLEKLLHAIKNNCNIPVSMKIRLPLGPQDKGLDVISAAENAEVDFIVVHGRHWQDDYSRSVNLERISGYVVASSLPIIANGDAHDSQSVKDIFNKTGCAAVMIARASVGQPWLYTQVSTELAGGEFTPPTLAQTGEIFLFHINGLAKLLDNEQAAVLQSRKLAKYYARQLSTKFEFIKQINSCTSLSQLTDITKHYFY